MEQIKRFLRVRYGMCHLFFIVMGMITMCIAGCSEESSDPHKTSRIEKDVADKLTKIPDVLANGKVDVFVDSIVSNISVLAGREKQIEWYWKALDEVFSVDISHHSYRCQYRGFCLIGDMWSGISAGLSKVSTKTWIERWQLRLKDLVWKQHQLKRLKTEYAELLPMTNVRPIPLSLQNRERGLKGVIECMQTDMFGEIDRFERWYVEEKDRMSHDDGAKIGDMFMTILGRPLRSLEQIETDCRKRNEKIRLAEEAATSKTNRPPPLILIDSTK